MNASDDPSVIAIRFRSGADWFVRVAIGDVYCWRIGAPSERAVDLLHALAAHVGAEVNLSIESVREGVAWQGAGLTRHAVRQALARLKSHLATYGGVEFVIFTREDQLTLTPEMEVIVYSRSDDWNARLTALGLEERSEVPAAVWIPSREMLRAAPALHEALVTVSEKLALHSATAELARAGAVPMEEA